MITVCTPKIKEIIEVSKKFEILLNACILRFYDGDWDECSDFDKAENDADKEHASGFYTICGFDVMIHRNDKLITILLAEEY